MERIFELTFPNGHQAKIVRIRRSSELPMTLDRLGLAAASPTLVLVGGASGISPEALRMLRSLFTDVLSPLIEELGLAVVDGGTDAGVMQLMGQARAQRTATFPLIGVAATGTVNLPNQPSAREGADLEPNHTHFVLVPGAFWGDEAPWIARVASSIATSTPSLTILVNGGKIAWQDVTNSVRVGRPVLVIAGSGRTADELAAAAWGDRSNERATQLVNSGLIRAISLTEGHQAIRQTIQDLLAVSIHR